MLWHVNTKPRVSVIQWLQYNVALDTNVIAIGDQINLQLTIDQPKGINVSFPVFTKDTLEEFRAKKDAYESTFKKFTDEQADQLEKMNLTNNPLMKAVHFKNAIGANEKASMMRTNAYDKFPPAEEHIISIGKDLLLCTKGTVHTKSAEQKGKKDHTHVGEASLKKIDHSEV